jgi:hypothetical protein
VFVGAVMTNSETAVSTTTQQRTGEAFEGDRPKEEQ